VGLLSAAGALTLSAGSFASAATFTCNIGFVDCDWWVAHTWSLAVEEQFYLAWPLLIALAAPRWRVPLLIAALIGCTVGIAINPHVFHSNFTSFGCIAAGALYALSPRVRMACQRATATPVWLAAVALLVVGPLTRLEVVAIVALPFLVTYIIFAGNALRWVRATLEWRVLQIIGAGSYSLYLWQQLFLGSPAHYTHAPFPIVLLPTADLLSVYLVERPFIRLGRRLSRQVEGAPA
jgi:peptidoglycan/LPS O-acetylase OafA/YrhL